MRVGEEGGWCARTFSALFFSSVVGRGEPRPGSLSNQSDTDWRGARGGRGGMGGRGRGGVGTGMVKRRSARCLCFRVTADRERRADREGRAGREFREGNDGNVGRGARLQTRLRACEEQSRKKNLQLGADLRGPAQLMSRPLSAHIKDRLDVPCSPSGRAQPCAKSLLEGGSSQCGARHCTPLSYA